MEPLAERLADLISRPVMVLDTALRILASARGPNDLVVRRRFDLVALRFGVPYLAYSAVRNARCGNHLTVSATHH
jgi:hypothetical protein